MQKRELLFITMEPKFDVSLNRFIDYWYYQSVHTSPQENTHLYENNIEERRYSSVQLFELYKWKLQTCSDRIGRSHDTLMDNLNVINRLKKKFVETTFQKTFGALSLEWKIYAGHIIDPYTFKYFDKYVYYGYQLIANKKILRKAPRDFLSEYESYLDFHAYLSELTDNNFYGSLQLGQVLRTLGKFVYNNPDMIAYHLGEQEKN